MKVPRGGVTEMGLPRPSGPRSPISATTSELSKPVTLTNRFYLRGPALRSGLAAARLVAF